ncbi:polysaccharide deacetylase 2 family uncharacterized protein YibQ [Rubricella aquisinus]|uniref:Polysaccharide deacetylase 2 family uncharacterized protein YibQ n=1 Tax=Rubricella aquisinus TaxID=2028108 RepID=A0A840WWP3_9RHOB|nr:divergent polysaccharide deacetylase family protein [Rubricella aquisinus]MBB5514734.1 polysaccharide deacetylase 2 family uncharacterized protein YibQ [Rubricella aquisinus]
MAFIKGFLTGSVVSIAGLSALAILQPIQIQTAAPEPVVSAAPATPAPQRDASIGSQTTAAQPVISTPAAPSAAPAVDPNIARDTGVLSPVEQITETPPAPAPTRRMAEAVAPLPEQPTGPRPAEQVTTQAGISGTANPERVRVGGGATQGLGAPAAQLPDETQQATASLPRTDGSGTILRPSAPQRTSVSSSLAPPSAPASPAPARAPQPRTLETTGNSFLPERTPVAEGQAPRELYAANFADTGARPLLSMLLVDAGEDGLATSALAGFQFPVTFAVPVDLPDAEERARAYRAAGFEVMAMVPRDERGDLSGLSAVEIEARLLAFLEAVPEAIGILDREGGDIPRDNGVTRAALATVAATGHILVTRRETGFNSVDALADVDGIPTATVTIVLPSGAGGDVIRSELNRASVNARSVGGLVVLGRTDRETITSLFTWVLGAGTRTVDLAPVTALVKRLDDAGEL